MKTWEIVVIAAACAVVAIVAVTAIFVVARTHSKRSEYAPVQ